MKYKVNFTHTNRSEDVEGVSSVRTSDQFVTFVNGSGDAIAIYRADKVLSVVVIKDPK